MLSNFPIKWVATLLRWTIFPLGMSLRPPLDSRNRECARIALEPGAARDRLTAGMYLPKGEHATGDAGGGVRRRGGLRADRQEAPQGVKKGKVDALRREMALLAMSRLISDESRSGRRRKRCASR